MDERNLEHLRYLDTILLYLRNGVDSSYLFKELFRIFEEKKISFDSKLETEFTDTSDNTIHLNGLNLEGFKEQVLYEAVLYLKDLNLITMRRKDGNTDVTITLTYRGRIKITTSFVEEYKKEQFEKRLRTQHMTDTQRVARIQMITLPLAIGVAIVAMLVSYCTSSSKGNIVNNHDTLCNYKNIEKHHQNINEK